MDSATQLQNLFPGLKKHFGRWSEEKDHQCIKWEGSLTLKQYREHIEGTNSLGVVPINEENKAHFGALDFDDHKKDKTKEIQPFKYKNLLDKIKFLKLPLTVFKSKSGGAHCYLFLDQWYSAQYVRDILGVFEYALGYENLEKFPKQTILKPDDDGSFINLPYFKGNSRVLINFDNKELNFDEALNYSSQRTVKLSDCKKFTLLKQGTRTQGRNDRTWCATAYLKKQIPDQLEEKTKEYNQIFNEPPLDERELENTVLKSHRKKEYNKSENEGTEPPPGWNEHDNFEGTTNNEPKTKELVGYDIRDYRKLPIEKPVFLIERLLKERSINFLFGAKGKGKTEFGLGLANALVRGLPFLHYTIPVCHPVTFIDGEMDPYDMIERDKFYLDTFGESPPDYLHIINFAHQLNQVIPDIREPLGQKLILNYLLKQEKLTGKKPFLFLDNLRSLSNYIENDADSFRPIGVWLKNLRGLGFASLTMDHTGHAQTHMRGTSSKSDWANVCLQIKPEGKKGLKVMKVKLSFDKARGLRPDETDDFVAQYDFKGNWILSKTDKAVGDDELKKHLREIIRTSPEKLKESKIGTTQQDWAKHLKIAVGTCNKLVKEISDEDSNEKTTPF